MDKNAALPVDGKWRGNPATDSFLVITFKFMKYRHLFFDLDHTLWDFEANAKECFQELYTDKHLQGRGINDFEAFFSAYSAHNERLWSEYTKGLILQAELRWRRMWLALMDFGIEDEPLSKAMSVDFLERLPYKKNLFPYTIEILEYLKNKDYVLHLITNGFQEIQDRKLRNAELQDYFQEVITSEAAQSLKPSRTIFDYALNLSKARPDESIMIGDNQEADIQGAANAGLDTVFVNHIQAVPQVQSTYMIHHLQELEDIF